MSGKWGTNRRFTPVEAADAYRMYVLEGRSLSQVGAELGRDATTVRNLFVRHGIELRDQKTAYRMWLESRKRAEAEAIRGVLA